VDFVYNSDRLERMFVKCLAALPNLHTLEVGCMLKVQDLGFSAAILGGRKLQLQQVRKLILPPTARFLLRSCPNVEDLTCCDMAPTEAFLESIVAGGLNRITKLSISCPKGSESLCSGGSTSFLTHHRRGDLIGILAGMARACPGVRELSLVHVSSTSVTLLLRVINSNRRSRSLPSLRETRHWDGGIPAFADHKNTSPHSKTSRQSYSYVALGVAGDPRTTQIG